MMKKLAIAIATASTLSAASLAQAEAFDTAVGELDVSMTATLATDYIWRGQSQTAGVGAVQGSLDIGHESGLYVGAWASNIDADAFGGSSVEIDYYVGYGADITDNISYDLSWNTYTYPGAGGNLDNVDEWILGFGVYGVDLAVKYAYDPSSALYYSAGYGFDLPAGFGLGFHVGYADTKDELNAPTDTSENYTDWAITVSKEILGLDTALMYSDTNIKSSTCDAWYGKSSYCSSNFTLSVSKSF
ncbi:TorF family putative porin [Halopseudomonas salegens]|uniref:Uncharacterized protein n=1 Tax=Halopseudomonas salegens TaxID=1434072 RepID=A0A1H2FPM1_9GAMM|nr:TorF family putative porin [Halopseudomonas salegens]SDU09311.1 conserved hypothetical protein [Halopseudomonas salegens]